jgi:hypothetical protein
VHPSIPGAGENDPGFRPAALSGMSVFWNWPVPDGCRAAVISAGIDG